MRALLSMTVLAGLLVVLLVVLPENGSAGARATAQAATEAAAAEANVALAHAAEISAAAEAEALVIAANTAAAEAAVQMQGERTRLALDSALRRSMNDLRVFGMGILLGTLAAGLPTLLGLVLLRLLLGAGWRQRLFGSGASPASATHGAYGSGDPPDAGDAAENVQPATPGAAVKHRHYEPQE